MDSDVLNGSGIVVITRKVPTCYAAVRPVAKRLLLYSERFVYCMKYNACEIIVICMCMSTCNAQHIKL